MIQRYNIYNHPIARISYQVAADDNGEWVKWEDVKHLALISEALNICTKLPENYDFFQKPIDVTEFLKEIQNDTTR
ncbi:MAG: hypothetical protein PHY56_06970 [Candidatus Omnitrophica bacterium]|nr:hypothetical protein [Candidatus Omnitrophota bacterium]